MREALGAEAVSKVWTNSKSNRVSHVAGLCRAGVLKDDTLPFLQQEWVDTSVHDPRSQTDKDSGRTQRMHRCRINTTQLFVTLRALAWRVYLERYAQISHIHRRMNINAHPGSLHSPQPLGQKYMTTISVSCFSGNETMSKAIMLAVQNTGSYKLPNAQVKSKSAQHKTYCRGARTNSCDLC